MTDGPVRVMPRKALVADPYLGGWKVLGEHLSHNALITYFVPADAYERLLAAVGAWFAAHDIDPLHAETELDMRDFWPADSESHELWHAYRAFVGSDL